MEQRLDYNQSAPEALRGMRDIEKYLQESNLERALLELVKIRASQINGCSYCIDKHFKEADLEGVNKEKLKSLESWKETSFFSERERAALLWTEAVTLISKDEVFDSLFKHAREHFEEKELVTLTMAVIAINGWNRLAISFGRIPEHDHTENQEV